MKRRIRNILILVAIAGAIVFVITRFTGNGNGKVEIKPVKPVRGDVQQSVSTTGTVCPQNRLEVIPSVAGRMEKISVNEGDFVRKGQIIGYMSSTDRAALIDAARAQGAAAIRYWEEAYKPVPVIAPIAGTVIVRTIEPGQTVTTSTVIAVISDKLIVKASVDETDIGRVQLNQRATVSLDAHPEIIAPGKVTRIYYESATSNNVTIYYVQIDCDKIPSVFRSGMSANIEIIDKVHRNALLVPVSAVMGDNGGKYVLVEKTSRKKGDKPVPEKRPVETGLSNDGMIEITNGLSDDDTILMTSKEFILPQTDNGKNMFMPNVKSPRRRGPGGPM